MSILGNRVLRREDPKFLTIGGTYVDDIRLEGAVYLTYVRSTMAHARITVDVSAATSAPGVIAVISGTDLDLTPLAPAMPMLNQGMLRPWLAADTVRFVGEAIAAIITEERYQGPDAAELVFVDYEPLPVVVDPEEALRGDVLLFPDVGNNVAVDLSFGNSGDELFQDCDVVVRKRIRNHRVAPCPLEVRAAAAAWGDDGRLTHWASTQNPHTLRDNIVRHLGLEAGQVRVIGPDVGGGFGAKAVVYPDEMLLGWLARRVGRPLRWVETRTESMTNMAHGRGQIQDIEIGGSRDGKVQAYRLTVIQDGGAYPSLGSFLPFLTRLMASGTYAIPKIEVNAKSVVTNTTPTDAYRGAGRPEATAAIERAMDLFAAEIGMDPADVRRRNLIAKDAFPYETPTGATYDSGDYERALDLLLGAADYARLRAEQKKRRDAGAPRQLGIGVSMYVEITNPVPGGEYGGLEITPDGKAVVRAGTFSHGQGHHTAWAMIVADRLGIDIDDVAFVQGDTDDVPSGQGTMGSRSLQVAGSAISQAAGEVADQARDLAAQLLEANPDDVVLDRATGRFHVTGTPAVAKTWAELGQAAAEAGNGKLRSDVDFMPQGPTFPFGAHLVVVEVDMETGKVEIQRIVTVDDSGRILNPLLVEGQRHGGIAQGVAQALMEEVRYDDDGNPITANLADYAFISAAELPSFELVPMETPTSLNELGAKGIGESGAIGATPAVQNAVVDALSHLGVRHVEMPVTAERVWRAINEAKT